MQECYQFKSLMTRAKEPANENINRINYIEADNHEEISY
jgi:hypothetical protein